MNTDVLITAVASYFVIVDPIGVGLIFRTLTEGKGIEYRRRMAVRAVLISLGVVLSFGFFGSAFLRRLGISIEAFRIAGGLLLLYVAFHMVTKPGALTSEMARAESEDISVFPLSFPLIAGPGCLTLTVLLFSGTKRSAGEIVSLVAAVALIYGLTLFCFLVSPILMRFVGKTANEVFRRLLGVVLASLAIQFIGVGIKDMMR